MTTHSNEKRSVDVVSACMRQDGFATFVLNTAEVTDEEAANGVHYYLVEADLLMAGYDEPFVHFDQHEAPAFLHAAVRRNMDSSGATPPNTSHFEKETPCPV